MSDVIVKLKDWYLIWSTSWDAPLVACDSADEVRAWIREEYGTRGLEQLPERLARVEAKGTSAMRDQSAINTIWLNRAGPDESTLTIEGIYRHYCLGEKIQDTWIVPGRVIGGDEDDEGPDYDAVVAGWQ